VLFEKRLDKIGLGRAQVRRDLLVAARRAHSNGRKVLSVQRALVGESHLASTRTEALEPHGIGVADQNGQHRVVPRGLVVIELSVAQVQREDPQLDRVDQWGSRW
jgi:hypothetical protein